MNELLEDWNKYCRGEQDFDHGHFTCLFDGADADFDVSEIYRYFPSRDALIKLFYSRIPEKHKNLRGEELTEAVRGLVKDDVSLKVEILKQSGEEAAANQISALPINFAASDAEYQKALYSDLNAIYDEGIGDYMITHLIRGEYKTSDLLEALYWYSQDYGMAWFYLQPLLNLDIDLSSYRILTGLRARYCIANDCVLVSFG